MKTGKPTVLIFMINLIGVLSFVGLCFIGIINPIRFSLFTFAGLGIVSMTLFFSIAAIIDVLQDIKNRLPKVE